LRVTRKVEKGFSVGYGPVFTAFYDILSGKRKKFARKKEKDRCQVMKSHGTGQILLYLRTFPTGCASAEPI
jgi:hypothetical protein